MTQQTWTDTDKAAWILANGTPEYVWIYERVDDKVFKRPVPEKGKHLPPWVSTERELAYITQKDTFIHASEEFAQYSKGVKHD